MPKKEKYSNLLEFTKDLILTKTKKMKNLPFNAYIVNSLL